MFESWAVGAGFRAAASRLRLGSLLAQFPNRPLESRLRSFPSCRAGPKPLTHRISLLAKLRPRAFFTDGKEQKVTNSKQKLSEAPNFWLKAPKMKRPSQASSKIGKRPQSGSSTCFAGGRSFQKHARSERENFFEEFVK